jgi:hypothetical protein
LNLEVGGDRELLKVINSGREERRSKVERKREGKNQAHDVRQARRIMRWQEAQAQARKGEEPLEPFDSWQGCFSRKGE